MRQQQQATTTSNPASGTGIYQNTSQFSNTSPPHSSHSQQHSQQSQSTVGVTIPTLPITNPQFPQNFHHPPPSTSLTGQPIIKLPGKTPSLSTIYTTTSESITVRPA